MTDAFIDIRRIEKRFGAITAVAPSDLQIGSGEFFSLLGASGCGKTTLLRMIGGLEQPSGGKVFIDGSDITRLPAYRRPTNMVFQNYAIFPHLTVGENIAYGLMRRRLTSEQRATEVERMLELIRLPGFAARQPDQLSGGQLQRVALARALVLKPKVLLLDEPLAALDKKLRENMQIELRRLQREVGITFILVTHDQEEALTLSDRIAVMQAGRILQCSSPRELYERPVSRDVAEFVGEMNFLPGRVVAVNGSHLSVEVAGFGRLTVPPAPGHLGAGQAVTLALRPERLSILADPGDGPAFEVRQSIYFGNRTLYQLNGPGLAQPLSVFHANDLERAADVFEAGARVGLLPDAGAAVILPEPAAAGPRPGAGSAAA